MSLPRIRQKLRFNRYEIKTCRIDLARDILEEADLMER